MSPRLMLVADDPLVRLRAPARAARDAPRST